LSKGRRQGRGHIDPADVLAGRAHLDARSLCALIHEVNPSGHSLSGHELSLRYALKTRLQSHFIRRFQGEIEVHQEPQKPGIISLRHWPTGADACHAVLELLDEDARSWAQRELDLGTFGVPSSRREPDPPPPPAVRGALRSPDPATPFGQSATHAGPATRRRPALPLSDDFSPPSSASARRLPIPDLLRAGERALEAFDYEMAQRRLSLALERTGGGAEAASAMLALLVDHLGADGDALALEARLSADALAEPEVRRLLAVAAARRGDRDKALRLADDLPDRRVALADVLAALARASIEAGDLESGARDLADVATRAPAHPEIEGLTELLDRRWAERRTLLEEEVRELLDAGRLEEAEPRAAALLRRWPENSMGRRAQRAVEDHRRATSAQRLLAQADAATEAGDAALALSLLRQALVLAAHEEAARPIRRRVAEIEAAERARLDRAEIEAVCRALEGPDRTDGLLAYLALSDARRQEVRARLVLTRQAPLPHLGWLEETGVKGSGARAKAATLAVIALERAINTSIGNINGKGDTPEATLDLLAPHAKILEAIGVARDVLEGARQRLADQRRREAYRAVKSAILALSEEGAEDRAEALLSGVSLGDLTASARAEAEAVRARIASARRRRTLQITFEKHRREGSLFSARDAANELLASAPDEDDRQRWLAALADLRADLRRSFCVHVLWSDPVPAGALEDLFLSGEQGALRLLLPEGQRMIFAQGHGSWVFLQEIDLATQALCASVILHTPEPLDLHKVEVSDGRLVLIGYFGWILEIALPSFDVERLYSVVRSGDPGAVLVKVAVPGFDEGAAAPAAAAAAETTALEMTRDLLEDVQIVPGTSFLWLLTRRRRTTCCVVVKEAARGPALREQRVDQKRAFIRAVPGLADPRVVVLRDDDGDLAVFDARGLAVGPVYSRLRALPNGVAPSPGGEGLFLLARDPGVKGGDSSKAPVAWLDLPLPGALPALPAKAAQGSLARVPCEAERHVIEGLTGDGAVAVATDRRAQMVFVLFESAGGAAELLGVRAREEVYRVPVPRRTRLLHDPASGRVIALAPRGAWPHQSGALAVELGPAPPDLGGSEELGLLPTSILTSFYGTCHLQGRGGQALQAHGGEAQPRVPADRERRCEARRPERARDFVLRAGAARALRRQGRPADVRVRALPDAPGGAPGPGGRARERAAMEPGARALLGPRSGRVR
jgi:hypothetical protein